MREAGIVKWYGGYNTKAGRENDFGFISRDGHPDLFVHRKQLHCPESSLAEGKAVSFQVGANPRNGKEEALDLRLLSDEDDPELIRFCAQSQERQLWMATLPRYLATLPTDDAANIAVERLDTLPSSEQERIVRALPVAVFGVSRDLREKLPIPMHVSLLVHWIAAPGSAAEHDAFILELIARFRSHKTRMIMPDVAGEKEAWDLLPAELLREPRVWPLVPNDLRVAVTAERVNEVWPALVKDEGAGWGGLGQEEKLLCIFRSIKERQSLPELVPADEPDLVVRGALVLMLAMHDPRLRQRAFAHAHTCFQDYVVDRAWASTAPLDLFPLLPHCRPKVVSYCEGRPWLTKEDKKTGSSRASRAFCPRLNQECDLFQIEVNETYRGNRWGARLYSEVNQEWGSWSLLELLEATGVVPSLPELTRSEEYVPRLAGWVNRLNEIRERLRCSVCRDSSFD